MNSINAYICGKYSSDLKLVLENLNFKDNHRLVIENLILITCSIKFYNLKVDVLIATESKTDSGFPWNQFTI